MLRLFSPNAFATDTDDGRTLPLLTRADVDATHAPGVTRVESAAAAAIAPPAASVAGPRVRVAGRTWEFACGACVRWLLACESGVSSRCGSGLVATYPVGVMRAGSGQWEGGRAANKSRPSLILPAGSGPAQWDLAEPHPLGWRAAGSGLVVLTLPLTLRRS